MRSVEIHFPKQGVNRRMAERRTERRGSYPCPWAVNVRMDDNFDRRLRGGSRPGLTKYVSTDYGTTIADMISIHVHDSDSGLVEELVVLTDSTMATGGSGTYALPTGYMTDSGGDTLTSLGGDNIVLGNVTAPASGYLIAGQQHVYAIVSSSMTKMNPRTGAKTALVATAGSLPRYTTFGAVYRDRLVLAGYDNCVHASRQGVHTGWDYGVDVGDQARAVLFQLSLAGEVGTLPTAMVAHKDSALLLSTVRSLWVLRGDPTTGSLQRVSENVGIVDKRAWCKHEDTVFFLSETGIYQVGADGSGLKVVSDDVPSELRDIDTSTVTVMLEYEHDRQTIHVYLKTAAGGDIHWVYELPTETWWPVQLEDNHSPNAVCRHAGKLLLGGSDGYVRYIGGDDDDGTDIESHVLIGPIRLGDNDRDGIINRLRGVLAAGSGTVTWRVVPGEYAEEAADNAKLAIETYQAAGDYSDYVKFTDTWTAGASKMQYPRVGAAWACIWLQSTDKWSFEGGTMQLKLSGRYRNG